MMHSFGRIYVGYFTLDSDRSRTLREGRFTSCLVLTERSLVEVYRYIELNPVRAMMVADPGEYRWSGYQAYALDKVSELCTPHQVYLSFVEEPFFR